MENKIKNKLSSEIEKQEFDELYKQNKQNCKLNNIENLPELVFISGMSGGGRTEAIHVFEDMGYFCVDNLPANLILNFIDTEMSRVKSAKTKRMRIAVVVDARNKEYFKFLNDVIDQINNRKIDYRIVFLDANDDRLISRYKSSRRRHPMCEDGQTIVEGIKKERELLYFLRESADFIIDTSDMLPQDLRSQLNTLFKVENQTKGLNITVYSFGFKNGAALDADLVIDVRFLPNPYWDPNLRHLNGLDEPVRDFVMGRTETRNFLSKWNDLLDVLIPGYVKEGKQQLAIAIGCTGGQHRSVAIAENTGNYLKSSGFRVSIAHRDLQILKSSLNETDTMPLNLKNLDISGRIPVIEDNSSE